MNQESKESKESKESDKTICLNMIVKDESHIIIETLKNILEHIKIDYWIIADTGSSDNTQQLIISFFKDKEIQGELIQHSWSDFGTNRTMALESAYNKTDYLLIFDADDCFIGNFILPDLIYDMYYLRMSNGQYYRPLLINNKKKWKFMGVLHEYLEKNEDFQPTTCHLSDKNYYVDSRRIGRRNADPQKYIKDANILKSAYHKSVENKDHLANRYVFYCANSYKDAGLTNEALEWYKKTLTHQGWIQERYVSCLRIYECYEQLGRKEEGFYYLIKSYEYDKERLECMYKLITHYCCENQHEIAFSFYSLIREPFENDYNYDSNNKLFIDLPISDFYLPYIMIIVSYHIKKREIGLFMYETIFKKKFKAPEWYLKNLIYNMKFFNDMFTQKTLELLESYKKSYDLFDKLIKEKIEG